MSKYINFLILEFIPILLPQNAKVFEITYLCKLYA